MNTYYVVLRDKTTNKVFKKTFDSYYIFDRFMNKLRFSKKLEVLEHNYIKQ